MSPTGENRRLVLASASPRRQRLLAEAGYVFDLLPVDVDETAPPSLAPAEVARHLATRKARAAAEVLLARADANGAAVLAGDTVVALDGRTIGKPADRAEARQILSRLAGTEHRVITALCLLDPATGRSLVDHDETRVRLRGMTGTEIEAYVASGESDGKAGAYAIQETGDRFVSERHGSWTNVVGMPLELFSRMWRSFPDV